MPGEAVKIPGTVSRQMCVCVCVSAATDILRVFCCCLRLLAWQVSDEDCGGGLCLAGQAPAPDSSQCIPEQAIQPLYFCQALLELCSILS